MEVTLKNKCLCESMHSPGGGWGVGLEVGLSRACAPQAARGGAWSVSPAPLAQELPKISGTPDTCCAQLRLYICSTPTEDTKKGLEGDRGPAQGEF